jgi:hypothetical protein
MRFVIDLDTLYLIESTKDRRPVSMVSLKRGDDAEFEVVFFRSGSPQELPALALLTFGAKEAGKYDSEPVVFSNEFTLAGSGKTACYLGNPSFNTVGLNELLKIDGDPANDLPFVDVMAEFTWQLEDGPPTTTKTFLFRVHNDVIRGDEGTPSALPAPDDTWVAHGRSQTLTDAQKSQAHANIGSSASIDAAGADPNAYIKVIADGLAGDAPIVFEPLVFGPAGSFHAQSWANASNWSAASQAFWIDDTDPLYWRLTAENGTANWTSLDGGVTWTPADTETGTPSISDSPLPATHTGQWCRVATADPEVFSWWQWNGSAWVFVRTDGEVPGADITADAITAALGYTPADVDNLGSAATQNIEAFATAAQGSLAATALQPTIATKTTPVDADTVDLQDSAASGARKLLTFASLKTWVHGVVNAMATITGAKTLSGQLELTGQAATTANSAMTRGLVRGELSQNEWIPLSWNAPTGTTNTFASNAGISFTIQVSQNAVAGNNRICTVYRNPLARPGSGANMRLASSKFSLLISGAQNIMSNTETRLLIGVAAATTSLDSVVGIGVVWTSITTVKLQINNGTLAESSAFTIPSFDFNRLHRWLVVWDGSTVYLYNQNFTDVSELGRWVFVGSLIGTSIPATGSGTSINMAVVATGTVGVSSNISVDAALFVPYAITP